MKSQMPYYGVSSPDRKLICRTIFKEFPPENNAEYRSCLMHIFNQSRFREEWYCSMDYGMRFRKYILAENVDLYLTLVRKTQWWDTVDGIAAGLIGPALLNNSELPGILKEWILDEDMWVRRTALLTQLKYKADTNFELLKELILQVTHEKDFFIRKAIGWVLRQYSYTDSDQVLAFISQYETRLSPLSIKEGKKGIQRIMKNG